MIAKDLITKLKELNPETIIECYDPQLEEVLPILQLLEEEGCIYVSNFDEEELKNAISLGIEVL